MLSYALYQQQDAEDMIILAVDISANEATSPAGPNASIKRKTAVVMVSAVSFLSRCTSNDSLTIHNAPFHSRPPSSRCCGLLPINCQ